MACTSCKKKNKTVDKMVTEFVKESSFKLRSNIGIIQIDFGSGLFISPTNCDDALATQFLKANPNRISLFETYPDNWKELINSPTVEDNSNSKDEDAVVEIVSDKVSNEAKDAGISK